MCKRKIAAHVIKYSICGIGQYDNNDDFCISN
jgi:hypothetical protein